jgi:hypothetical protein
MCTSARKKRRQSPAVSVVSEAEDVVPTQPQQYTVSGRDLAPCQEWVEAHRKTLPTSFTLLELVQSVNSYTASDIETVAVVMYLINSGRVQLRGTFAGTKISFSQRRPRFTRRRAVAQRLSRHTDE